MTKLGDPAKAIAAVLAQRCPTAKPLTAQDVVKLYDIEIAKMLACQPGGNSPERYGWFERMFQLADGREQAWRRANPDWAIVSSDEPPFDPSTLPVEDDQ